MSECVRKNATAANGHLNFWTMMTNQQMECEFWGTVWYRMFRQSHVPQRRYSIAILWGKVMINHEFCLIPIGSPYRIGENATIICTWGYHANREYITNDLFLFCPRIETPLATFRGRGLLATIATISRGPQALFMDFPHQISNWGISNPKTE